MGPGQGCFIVDDSNSNVNIHSLMNYCSDKFEKYEANSKSRTLATPYNGFVWNKNTVKYQISSVNDPGNEIKNKIKSGLQVWNGFSSMVISEATSSQSYDIEIIVGTGFGECAGYADYIDTMKIYIYTNKFDTSNLSYWHRIAGHEMGHMLGLGHNETGASSIMNPKVVNMSGSPEYVDIIAIQGLYP